VADLVNLKSGQAKLSVYTNEKGGIIDDTMITNAGDYLYVVVNAGCKDKDIKHIKAHLSKFTAKKGNEVSVEVLDNFQSLIALQGPLAHIALQRHVKIDLKKFYFMDGTITKVAGIECRVTRCGYTGEDGFEISVPSKEVVKLTELLLKEKDVVLAGLGARDALRLEAGLCLYGNDLDETTTPVEASLTWVIGKRRKEEGGFLGDKVILDQLKNGVKRKRVGFFVDGAPARAHAPILSEDGKTKIGEVTSGSFSPILKRPIAVGYVQTEYSSVDTNLKVNVRDKLYNAVITKLPFVENKYYKPATK